MAKEARELSSFPALVVDATTKTMHPTLAAKNIRCFQKGCYGVINSAARGADKEIHWYCPVCENEGIINHWEGT